MSVYDGQIDRIQIKYLVQLNVLFRGKSGRSIVWNKNAVCKFVLHKRKEK